MCVCLPWPLHSNLSDCIKIDKRGPMSLPKLVNKYRYTLHQHHDRKSFFCRKVIYQNDIKVHYYYLSKCLCLSFCSLCVYLSVCHHHGFDPLLTSKFSLKPTLSLWCSGGPGGWERPEEWVEERGHSTDGFPLLPTLSLFLSLSLGTSSAERPTGKGGHSEAVEWRGDENTGGWGTAYGRRKGREREMCCSHGPAKMMGWLSVKQNTNYNLCHHNVRNLSSKTSSFHVDAEGKYRTPTLLGISFIYICIKKINIEFKS